MSSKRKPPHRRPGPPPRREPQVRVGADLLGRAAAVTSTGMMQAGNPARINQPIDWPPPGDHLWTFVGAWRVTDPAAEHQDFDRENLISMNGPVCLRCEEPYEAIRAALPCPGDPSPDEQPGGMA